MANANRAKTISPLRSRGASGCDAAKHNLVASVDQLLAYIQDQDNHEHGLVVPIAGIPNTYGFSAQAALCYIGVYGKWMTMQLALLQKLGVVTKVNAKTGAHEGGFYHYSFSSNAADRIRRVSRAKLQAAWDEYRGEFEDNLEMWARVHVLADRQQRRSTTRPATRRRRTAG